MVAVAAAAAKIKFDLWNDWIDSCIVKEKHQQYNTCSCTPVHTVTLLMKNGQAVREIHTASICTITKCLMNFYGHY